MPATDPATSERMSRIRNRGTAAELAVRRVLFARGLRYRLDRPIEGAGRTRPDMVFVGPRVAVFVDGCFWHRCPDHGTDPQRNAAWWREKLDRNVERDRATDQKLAELGWSVVRVWEHESPATAADRIEAAVRGR